MRGGTCDRVIQGVRADVRHGEPSPQQEVDPADNTATRIERSWDEGEGPTWLVAKLAVPWLASQTHQ